VHVFCLVSYSLRATSVWISSPDTDTDIGIGNDTGTVREYHLKIDVSPLYSEDDSAIYRSMIDCCILIIEFGRYDKAYHFYHIKFNMLSREGNLKVVKKILSYLNEF
jgi:hypothetical protein